MSGGKRGDHVELGLFSQASFVARELGHDGAAVGDDDIDLHR